MIYTTYFANLKNLPENIIPISICGKSPDGWSGLECKLLAPKYEFFKVWKETQDNDYYVRCYKDQVLSFLTPQMILTSIFDKLPERIKSSGIDIISLDSEYHIALVCYENPAKFCHRHLVSRWFKQNGIPCYEWRKDNNYEGL